MASTDIIQIDQIAPVAFEEALVHAALQAFQPVAVLDDGPVAFVEVQLPAHHLAVHDLRQRDHLAGGAALDDDGLGGALLQAFDNPVHGALKTPRVQRLEEIAAGVHLEGVEYARLEDGHKDQQAALPPPAQPPGGLHAVGMAHLNVQQDHVKAVPAFQKGTAVGKAADAAAVGPAGLHIGRESGAERLGHLRLVVTNGKFYHVRRHPPTLCYHSSGLMGILPRQRKFLIVRIGSRPGYGPPPDRPAYRPPPAR